MREGYPGEVFNSELSLSWVSEFHFFLSFELGFRRFFFKENRLKFHVKKKREMLKIKFVLYMF